MKKLISTVCALLFSISLMQAQEFKIAKKDNKNKEKLHVKAKEGAEPDIYVDGKKFDFSLDLIDNDMIASASIMTGEMAIKEYNAPNGVILITTKKKDDSEKTNGKTDFNAKASVIIINGKVSGKETLDKLSPDDIEKVEVFKGEKAIKKYNAPNGAIVITTKQKKKE